jgi:phospholipase/carboxylesterase
MSSLLRALILLACCLLVGGCSWGKPEGVEAPTPTARLARTSSVQEIDYVMSLTGDAREGATLPMLVLIHGYGGTPEKMLQSFGNLSGSARVISLRGGRSPHRGFIWFPIRVRDPDLERLSAGLSAAGVRVAAQLEVLTSRYSTRGKPVVAGFSQGAMIAFELGLRHPDSLGASLILAGYYPPQSFPNEGPTPSTPPMLVIHGTADDVLPVEGMRAAIAHVNSLGYGIKHWEYEGMQHGLTEEAHGRAMELIQRELDAQSAL